jgi:hypothetical protein
VANWAPRKQEQNEIVNKETKKETKFINRTEGLTVEWHEELLGWSGVP